MRKWIILAILAAAVLVGLAGALLYNGVENLYLHHERAYRLWAARQPVHYRYTLILQGEVMHQTFGVEVDQGRLVRLTDVYTGLSMTIPPTASTSFLPINDWLRRHLLIDSLFLQIKVAIHPPRAADAFLARANPGLYYRLAQKGWLSTWRPTCEPNFPRAKYNAVFGFPEELHLSGEPCAYGEEASPVHLRIEDFQPLP